MRHFQIQMLYVWMDVDLCMDGYVYVICVKVSVNLFEINITRKVEVGLEQNLVGRPSRGVKVF